MYNAKNYDTRTTLAAALAADATSGTLTDGTKPPAVPCLITIEDEIIAVGVINGNAISSLVRGMEGTANVDHPSGATVVSNFTKGMYEDTFKRGNHSGSQLAATISDFATTVRSTVLTGVSITTNAVITATDTVLTALGKLQKQVSDNLTTLTSHTGNKDNPHAVTASNVGLGSVDNTADLDKPVSTATQLALDDKVDDSQVLTDVPVGALFTDTVYIHPVSHLASMISDFAATVRSTVLTGLSTATSGVIATTDTVLGALGKLQAQISAITAVKTATITTTWVGTVAPYTQEITVTGITANDEPSFGVVYSVDNATAILEKTAWNLIGKIETGAGKITVTCFEEKPVTAIPIQIKGV